MDENWSKNIEIVFDAFEFSMPLAFLYVAAVRRRWNNLEMLIESFRSFDIVGAMVDQ